jgi:hypothetical protein
MDLAYLRAEKFNEAFFDLRVALLQLIGIGWEQFKSLSLVYPPDK